MSATFSALTGFAAFSGFTAVARRAPRRVRGTTGAAVTAGALVDAPTHVRGAGPDRSSPGRRPRLTGGAQTGAWVPGVTATGTAGQ
jgi:hypothetical protein